MAERVYNLQDVPNLRRIIKEIKQGSLASRFAEIDAATHLYRREIPFSFVNPQGRVEHDYDIEINYEFPIHCEVKHKIETTALSEETLRETLEHAVSQVPKNEPSFFIVKIPEAWVKNPLINDVINKVLTIFFKKWRYVLGVLFKWEVRHDGQPGVFYWKYTLKKNDQFMGMANPLDFYSKIESAGTKWTGLDDLIQKYCFDDNINKVGR